MIDRWIEVVGWKKFQHYKNRNPPWIRLYTDLHSSEEYLALSGHLRAVLVGIWIEFARSNGQLNTVSLQRRLSLKVTSRHLDALNHAGFITLSASKPLAARYSRQTENKSPYGALVQADGAPAPEPAKEAHADAPTEPRQLPTVASDWLDDAKREKRKKHKTPEPIADEWKPSY